MSAELRPLIMRANRLLGAALVEHNLVTLEQLEKANERLLEAVAMGDVRRCSLLSILVYEEKVLNEDHLLAHLVDNTGLGLVDLRTLDIADDIRRKVDPSVAWATWSVPFDREDGVWMMATAYYLSPAVRTYWEKQLGGSVLWFATSIEQISDYVEKLQAEQAAQAPAEAIAHAA